MILAPTLSAFGGSSGVVRPTFSRDFAGEKTLNNGTGPAITFTRASNATYFDASGVLQTASNNAPRFDHDPVTGASRGLLIEEARTNLLVRGEEFENASWEKSNGSVTANSAAAPDGTTKADTFTENTTYGEHFIDQVLGSVTSGTTYSWSCFVKSNGKPTIALRFTTGATWSTVAGEVAAAFFDLSSGTITQTTGGATSTISSIGSGWYRVSITSTALATTFAGFRINLMGSGNYFYTGDGTSGLYIWGAQLEAGAFPTSYIPTSTAAATRSADSAVVTPISSFYNQSEGTVFCESATTALVAGDNQGIWGVGDNTLAFANGNTLWVNYGGSLSNRIAVGSLVSGVTVVNGINNTSVAQSANTFARSAVVYKLDDYAISTNGSSVATDTSGAVPPMPTGLSIGSLERAWANADFRINGWIKKFAYYPKRLSNTLLQNLTA